MKAAGSLSWYEVIFILDEIIKLSMFRNAIAQKFEDDKDGFSTGGMM